VAAVESGDLAATVAANNDFHAAVAEIAGNAVLAQLSEIVGRRVRWYYRKVAPARGHESWSEHAELLAAIEAGDEDQAAALARVHTERTRTAYHDPVAAASPPPGGHPKTGKRRRR
jgi:DNA-binding GntR family transcriptional regulator